MTRPDWRDMGRDAFDTDAPPGELFTLTPGMVSAPVDGCGTGDLLAEIPPDA